MGLGVGGVAGPIVMVSLLAVPLDAVLQAVQLPAGTADLNARLADVKA